MYFMTQTRVDICFAVGWLFRQLKKPTEFHLFAAKNLLRYLNSTKSYCINYRSEDILPIGFADSDFAGCRTSAKSTWGYLFKVFEGPVSWKSKLCTHVTFSTFEAEYFGLTKATKKASWLKGLFSEIDKLIKTFILLCEDNLSANSKAHDFVFHNRTKHCLVKFCYVQEMIKLGLIAIKYLDTNRMFADGLTKALALQKFKRFLGLLGLNFENQSF